MKFGWILAAAVLAVSIALAGRALAQATPAAAPITSGSPQAVDAIRKLKAAATSYKENSMSYSGEDSDLGLYYGRKASDAQMLIDRLKQGESITTDQLKKALTSPGAERFGGD
jgi:hypothetical protein